MKLPSMTYSRNALVHFEQVIDKEWLITNGLGGYASSSILGINTRKYHGLLVAALHPPGDRTVCLSKLDEDVIIGKTIYRLGTNDFHDTMYPEGYRYLTDFSVSPNPIFTYDVGGVKINKTVFMPKNKNATVVLYHVTNNSALEAVVVIYPLLTCRYYHTVVDSQKSPLEFVQQNIPNGYKVIFKRPQATISSCITDGIYHESLNWIDLLHYRDETERSEADVDDLFQPGFFMFNLPGNTEKEFAVTTTVNSNAKEGDAVLDSIGKTISQVRAAIELNSNLNRDLLDDFYHLHHEVPMSDWLNWILLAADSFIVDDTDGNKSIIAGYHWFEPWGRDTFISLTGLMLTTGKFNQAKNTLHNYIQYCKGGLIPNFIGDKTGEPAYNTVDATFWYVNSVLQYLKYTGDYSFVQNKLWDQMQSIIENHQKGTLFDIRLDCDGLIIHGPRLTWMDAQVDGDVITPRAGKAVEIQALWYNALRTMALIADKLNEGDIAETYLSMAQQTSKSFNEKFWNPELDCLYDFIDSNGKPDSSMRPNQIFAVSLDFSMLDPAKSQKVVDLVNRELVTPFGLRTLSINDPKFVGKCFGNLRCRDSAYHNGTIWPWLLGPYVTAYLKVNGYTKQSRDFVFENWVLPLFTTGIHQGGLGTINEIYDCDTPNEPRGCISQAWSIGEPLRAYIEDVLMIKPNFSILP
jgi:predicted glycogen debranching enzyme